MGLGDDIRERLANDPDPYLAYRLRNLPQHANAAAQNYLGPIEHRQFVSELMARNPMLGILAAAVAPAYTGAKAMGLTNARSAPSLDEIGQAWRGLIPFRMF